MTNKLDPNDTKGGRSCELNNRRQYFFHKQNPNKGFQHWM